MPDSGGAPLEPEIATEETAGLPAVTLEFQLAGNDPSALTRLPFLTRPTSRRPTRLVWYDDPERSLAAGHLSLMHDGTAWQLDRSAPGDINDWPACRPPPPLSRAQSPADLSPSVPLDLGPACAFEGTLQQFRAGEVAADFLHGTVHGVVDGRPACRVTLTGPVSAVWELLPSLAGVPLTVPRASLAQEALDIASGAPRRARHRGAPVLPGDRSVSDGLASILSHLLDTLLFWTDAIRDDCQPEAVHQARVTTRRLRSALSIYRPLYPALGPLADDAKHCAAMLGAVRDWDVFLAGNGAALAAASDNDRRVGQLLRTAARKRATAAVALSDFLAGDDFRRLEFTLGTAAALQPWTFDALADSAKLAEPTAAFAAGVLTRHLKRARRRGRAIDTLAIDALHELRKDCKRLRYAAEFFAPAFPVRHTKPFLRRLADLQEHLGALNDTAASALLMGQLGRAGSGYAGGMANGLAAAAALPVRKRIVKSWKQFKRIDPFWR